MPVSKCIRLIDFARSICSKFGADAEVFAMFDPENRYHLVDIWFLSRLAIISEYYERKNDIDYLTVINV